MSEEKKEMPGWAVRANDELVQLNERIDKLLAALAEKKAPENQEALMSLQIQAMNLYAHFLGSRLMMAGYLKED